MKMKKIVALFAMTAMLGAMVVGCGSKEEAPAEEPAVEDTDAEAPAEEAEPETSDISGEVITSGSSALMPLTEAAFDGFTAMYPNISLTLNAGGSGTGLKQVADGTVTIGNSDLFAEEKLEADVAAELVDNKVCTVTMAAVVNKDLGVTDLSKEDLIKVFTGEVANWSEVGGPDEAILLVTRPDSSGTRALFTQYALDGNAENTGASYLETDNSGELAQTVKDNKGAIGYVALSYLVNDTELATVAIDGIEPTLENTYSGDYKVWGFEHMYTKGAGTDADNAFIGYMMSDEFGVEVEKNGYGVTSKMSPEALDGRE